MRPASDRKPADPRRTGSSDPLAELAKIVSGRPTPPTSRGRGAVNDPASSPAGGDVLGDLETELLNDLQASFAAVRDMAPPTPRAAPASPPPPPSVQPAAPLRSEAPRAERAPAPPPTPPAPEPVSNADYARAERALSELAEMFAPVAPTREPEPEMEPQREPERPSQARAEPRQPPPRLVPTAPPIQPMQSGPSIHSEPDMAPERPVRATKAPASKPDLGAFQMRASTPPPAPPPPPAVSSRQSHSRWERPGTDKPGAAGSRFAPPRQPGVSPRAPVADDNESDLFQEGGLFAAPEGDDYERAENFPLEGFGEPPPYQEDDEQPPYQEDLASMIEPRRSRGLVLAASVIGVVLVGGIAVAMFRPGGTTSDIPPVIVADGEPTKITPSDTSADGDDTSKLIYDRVDSGEENAETTLLAPGDEPLAAVPADEVNDNPITRVIIPGGPGIDAPADEGLSLDGQPSTMPEGAAAAADELAGSDPAEETGGPRRVRTVIVKPDGTIVESTAAEAGAAPAAAAAAPVVEVAPPPAVEPQPVTNDTAAIAGDGNGELQITPVPDAGLADGASVAAEPLPVPDPQPAPAPVAVAAADPEPMSLAPPEPAAAAVPAAAASGMLVQVSSQRSEDAARATYRDLQERYPGILGSFEPNIQRAEVADRGTFFRVRVGPFSNGDAQRLCDDLKSAGGDCILAQR